MSDWLIPYIMFNGNCETAVKFYQKVLGGEAAILHFGDAPANPSFAFPEEQKNLVMHAELRKDGHIIRFSDTCSDLPFVQANNISFSLEFDTQEETKAAFEALAEGGSIQMDLEQTFFSPLYGKVVDQFGIMWQISCRPHS